MCRGINSRANTSPRSSKLTPAQDLTLEFTPFRAIACSLIKSKQNPCFYALAPIRGLAPFPEDRHRALFFIKPFLSIFRKDPTAACHKFRIVDYHGVSMAIGVIAVQIPMMGYADAQFNRHESHCNDFLGSSNPKS